MHGGPGAAGLAMKETQSLCSPVVVGGFGWQTETAHQQEHFWEPWCFRGNVNQLAGREVGADAFGGSA